MNTPTLRILSCTCAALVLSFALAGCARQIRRQANDDLQNAVLCCSDFGAFAYSRIDDKPVRFAMNAQSPAFQFDSGKSFFKAFELPPVRNGLKLTLTSFSNQTTGAYFLPDVLVLDSQFKEIRRFEGPLLRQPNRKVVAIFQQSIHDELIIPKEQREARFVVVLSTDPKVTARVKITSSATMVAGPGVVIPITSTASPVANPEGEVQLEVSPVGGD
jgi:hypothetical protein